MPPKKLEGKKCLKSHCFGHFQAGHPNRKTLKFRVVEQIKAIKEELNEEGERNEDERNDEPIVTGLYML